MLLPAWFVVVKCQGCLGSGCICPRVTPAAKDVVVRDPCTPWCLGVVGQARCRRCPPGLRDPGGTRLCGAGRDLWRLGNFAPCAFVRHEDNSKRKRQAQEQRSSFRGTRAPGRKARCALAPCLLRYLLISTWGLNNRQKEPSRVCYSPPAPRFSCRSFHGGAIWVLDAESCPLTGAGCSAWPVGPRWQGACVSAWSGLAPHQPSGPRTSHLSHSGVTRA